MDTSLIPPTPRPLSHLAPERLRPLLRRAVLCLLGALLCGLATALSATPAAGEPEIAFSGNGVEIANDDTTPSEADGTDFGTSTYTPGVSGPVHTFTITNTGTGALVLGNPQDIPLIWILGPDADDFTVAANPASPIAGDGGTTTFAIAFTPRAGGSRHATVMLIGTNDPDEYVYTFAIQATGIVTPGVAVALDHLKPNRLVHFNPAGTSTAMVDVFITGVTAGEQIMALDTRPATGELLALGIDSVRNQGTLYTIVPATGLATPIGTPGSVTLVDRQGDRIAMPLFPTTYYDLAVNPVTDEVRVVTSGALNFRINPVTGLPVDGDFGGSPSPGVNPDAQISGIYSEGLRGAAYTDSVAGATSTALYTLEWQYDRGAVIASHGPQGPITRKDLGIQFDVVNGYLYLLGFDIPANVTVTASNSNAPAGYGYVLIADGFGDCEVMRIKLSNGVIVFRKKMGRELFSLALLSTPFEPAQLLGPSVQNVTERQATISGDALSDGGTGYLRSGVIIAQTADDADPKLGDPKVKFGYAGNGTGYFAYAFFDLLPETSYSYRVFAINRNDSFEVAYSPVYTFTTAAAPDFGGEDDFVVTTGGDRRIYPLRNDVSPTGGRSFRLVSVNDPRIAIHGGSLLIPAGYMGSFAYRFTDGTKIGQASVYVSSARPQTVYSTLLRDRFGEVIGSADVVFSPSVRTASVLLKVRNSVTRLLVNFPANSPTAYRQTEFGMLYVATYEDGQIFVDLIPEEVDDRLGGFLKPRHTAGARTRYHLALADSAGVLRGGGFAFVTVLPSASVILTALLPDGSVFSSSTSLREDMTIPIFASVGRGVVPQASVNGELALDDLAASDLSGEWNWRKPKQRVGVGGLYLDGVNALLSAYGSRYAGQIALDGSGVLGIDGGDLAPQDELGENVAITAGRPNLPLGVLQSWVTYSKYGIFYVGLKIPGRPGTVIGRGIYLPKSQTAAGFFPGTTVGGRVVLSP